MSIGTMLNGWRIYLPGPDGRPLVNGRVRFYNAGTADDTEIEAEVFADKELSKTLGTVVYADSNGVLPTIWLSNSHLYKAVVEKLVSRYPEEVWNTVYDIDDIGSNESAENTVFTPIRVCESIGELANLPEDDRYGFVEVLGVNERYDIDYTLFFVWDESISEDNLGYAFVKPYGHETNGRWVQIFSGEYIDVRSFGAFPNGEDCSAKILQALRYATNTIYNNGIKKVAIKLAGNYGISGSINLSYFTTVDRDMPVQVLIGKEVRFINRSADSNPTITISSSTTIESDSEIVGENVKLVFDGSSVGYIRPQWFNSEDGSLARPLSKAATLECNPNRIDVKVYGNIAYQNKRLPEFTATSKIIWDSEFKFVDSGNQRGSFVAGNGFVCDSRLVFDSPSSQWSCKFPKNKEIDSEWCNSVQKIVDSVEECTQVLRIHSTTITGSINAMLPRVLIDGVLTIGNDSIVRFGKILNGPNYKIFDILPAESGHSRGRVFTTTEDVSLDWFIGERDQVPENLTLNNESFSDISNAAGSSSRLFFRTEVSIDGTIEVGGVRKEFAGLKLKDGSIKFYCPIKLIDCKMSNVDITINGESASIHNCYFNNSTVWALVNDSISITGNTFNGQNEKETVIRITAPRTCSGNVSDNIFHECSRIVKLDPIASLDEYATLSRITLSGNSVPNESAQVYTDSFKKNIIVDFDKKYKSFSHFNNKSIYYYEFTINSNTTNTISRKMLDEYGKYVVTISGLKICTLDSQGLHDVHCFGVSEFKSEIRLSELNGKKFKIVYDSDFGYGISDAEYAELKAEGFFDDFGTTLYAIGSMYHSLSGNNRLNLWINVDRGNIS